MDHWGDPWADDDGADAQPPTPKVEVKTSPIAIPLPAQGDLVLNGFLDDAQWGSVAAEEEDGGGWKDTQPANVEESRAEARPASVASPPPVAAFTVEDGAWGGPDDGGEALGSPDRHTEVASDSESTIEPDDKHEQATADVAETAHPEDGLSTRSSTSRSDLSQPEASVESPRTSFEDERVPAKVVEADVPASEPEETDENHRPEVRDEDEDFPESFQEPQGEPVEEEPVAEGRDKTEKEALTSASPASAFELEPSLLAELFPPVKPTSELPEAPDDPISTTSARKAWYRLTRKETMREFNSGGPENTYVRVNWPTSETRSKVTKIVSRWAAEDRMSGRGPAGRASFYWDQPPKFEDKRQSLPPNALRRKSVVAIPSPHQPAKQNLQPLATDVPAAFNWNSPLATHDDWNQDSESNRPVSSVEAKPVPASTHSQHQHRSTSVDLARDKPLSNHKKVVSMVNPPTNKIRYIPPPTNGFSNTPITAATQYEQRAPNTGLNIQPLESSFNDDDDEWGEMVESPGLSTPASMTFSQHTNFSGPLSTPSTTPKQTRESPIQPPISKHASPIVRLQGTVSPTSVRFGSNSLIPPHEVQGPIGPHILRPANKRVPSVSERRNAPMSSSIDEMVNTSLISHPATVAQSPSAISSTRPAERHSNPDPDDIDDFSAFESAAESPTPVTKIDPTPSAPNGSSSQDPWTNADFSFFESTPAISSTSTAPRSQHQPPSPSDPFAAFETPIPAPGISNSAGAQKAAEDQSIKSILSGLPDLGYMLQR